MIMSIQSMTITEREYPSNLQIMRMATTLAAAQERSPFIFVFFHHMPFGSGVHSLPPGRGNGQDSQSGYPLRKLDPLFFGAN